MKVALVGSHGQSWREAVQLDSSWEVWGLNDEYLLGPELFTRATRWFELHGDTPLTRARRPASHRARLGEFKGPTYTLFSLPSTIVDPRPFPIQRAAAIRDYFACTFAYQIALALLEGVTELRLYGTPLVGPREALVERPCVEWWLGYAEAKGVTVGVIHESPYGLARQRYRYAYHDQAERGMAYLFACNHFDWMPDWIRQEGRRLRHWRSLREGIRRTLMGRGRRPFGRR